MQTPNADGTPKYYIGVATNILNDTLLVVNLLDGGPAQRAGLLEGDVLMGVNNTPFGSDPHGDLVAALAHTAPIVLKVTRGADVLDITVVPAELD